MTGGCIARQYGCGCRRGACRADLRAARIHPGRNWAEMVIAFFSLWFMLVGVLTTALMLWRWLA